ncbi:MAG: hypothetical protein BWZ06_00816 [Bacteroidetes bacterium ADurb.BinA261]|jgi:hypothetical protein|nr:MAG: hypothetical protein BWZ06_00816 [Bacteroidetes bacterium ADurb.BinA261]
MKNRALVSIISKQTIPNYIFNKDKLMEGDEMLFIATQEMKNQADWLVQTLKCTDDEKEIILLAQNQEEKWNEMTDAIKTHLSHDKHYVVNLTGGTKYLSLAIYHLFCKYDSEFYYIPFPRNVVLKPFQDEEEAINYRLKIDEYLSLYGLKFRPLKRQTVRNKEYSEIFFQLFIQGFSENDSNILKIIRENYRDDGIKNIKSVELGINLKRKEIPIPGLTDFLDRIHFGNKENSLSKYEAQYLTGGWFEEYVYNKIKESIPADDMAIGVKLRKDEGVFDNDLDVVFTYHNHLFVIECKTGFDTNKMFNEIVYKAAAIKESMFGLPAHTYVFALSEDNEQLNKVAKSMNIIYYGKSYFTEIEKWNQIIGQILKIAKK